MGSSLWKKEELRQSHIFPPVARIVNVGTEWQLSCNPRTEMAKASMDIVAAIPVGKSELTADISLPDRARGLVVFAHGSGSSRHSPRNLHVAEVLNRATIGTMLIDLLTEEEETLDLAAAELRFDISLLGRRLTTITDWIGRQPGLRNLGLGYFGASTGAAAALVAAAERPNAVQAVVSRGGRVDLAGTALKRVRSPTLLIAGGDDTVVLDLNRLALSQLPRQWEHKLEIITGATHLFEEPGTLDQVAALARDWFGARLGRD
jgi:putative phosphoribosyl transferase